MNEVPKDLAFLHNLKHDYGYLYPKPLIERPGWWAAIMPFIFTHGLVIGKMGVWISYEDRWCYHDLNKAKTALDAWNGAGEPEGWHRHTSSGRRRPDGDPTLEYINP